MELKKVIEADGNFVDKSYRHITIENKNDLQKYLTSQLKHAFERMFSHPIIHLQAQIIGNIDGYNIKTEPAGKGLSIYVADKYTRKDEKNYVFNPLRGNDAHIHDDYVIMTCEGDQLWPPLAANTHSEVEKFANRVFNTVYKVEKVR